MDPASRRAALVVVVMAGVAGAVLILTQQAFQEPLLEWVAGDPAHTASRARLLMAAVGSLLVVPLLALAAYAWRMAGALEAARARGLKTVAAILVVAAVMLAAILWRLSVVLTH